MPLLEPTRELLRYLHDNPAVRAQICAGRNRTLLYAGDFFRPIWQELQWQKRRNPQLADKQMLHEVLERIAVPGTPYRHLLAWALELQHPWADNGFIAWRALSGIYAANAVGAVSFCIGSPISRATRIFAATEIPVLARNANIDGNTRELVAYFQRCLHAGREDINLGFIAG